MRIDWKVVLWMLVVASCSMYVQRSPDEVTQLPTNIYSLHDSLLVLTGYGQIVWFTEIHGSNDLELTHWINSKGQMGIHFPSAPHPMPLGYLDLSAVEGLTRGLNSLGYFSVTEEIIAAKIMKKRLGCLGFLFSEPVEWPRYELADVDILDRSVYASIFRFAALTHRVSYQVGEEERWPYVKELEVLSEGMEMIKKFMDEKSLSLRHDNIPGSR